MKVQTSDRYLRRILAEEIRDLKQEDLEDTFNYYKEREKHLSKEEKIYLEILEIEIKERGGNNGLNRSN